MQRPDDTSWMHIVADIHEGRSGVPDLLESLGLDVERTRLAVGDYAVGPGALVERKTAHGLPESLRDGRFWTQMASLRRGTTWPYLVVEGPWAGFLTKNAFRGVCIATADLGITVIRAIDARETAQWLVQIARRRQEPAERNRPRYAQRSKRTRQDLPGEALLSAVPGISVVTARTLLERFGTVRGIVEATPEDWMTVPGMGPRRAASLREAVGDPPSHLSATQMAVRHAT